MLSGVEHKGKNECMANHSIQLISYYIDIHNLTVWLYAMVNECTSSIPYYL